MSSIVARKFSEELGYLIGRSVLVETLENKQYSGILTAINENLDVILEKVTGAGEGIYKLLINGRNIKEIKLLEKPFDFKGLAERLNRVFPDLVKVREDIGAIIVMDKIKVTEKGVVEGSGLAAERVKAIYDEFVRETRKM